MPQMYPLNWMLMFTIFVFIFLITMNKLFYNYNSSFPQIPNNTQSYSLNQMNMWKW